MEQKSKQTAGTSQTDCIDLELGYFKSGVFSFGGTASLEKMYQKHFGRIPNRLSVTLMEMGLMVDCISEDDIRKALDDVQLVRFDAKVEYNEDSGFNTLDISHNIYEMFVTDELNGTSITVVTSDKIIGIESGKIELFHNDTTDNAKSCVSNLLSKLSMHSNIQNSRILLVTYRDGDFDTVPSELKKVDVDIAKHYNDDFLPVFKDIKSFLLKRESGLIILHGKKGTGKTNFIRYLCQTMPKKYIIVTSSVASRLGSPEFISFMMRNKDAVFILEDCEQILKDRSVNSFGEAISTILNMSDGLLSDVFNAKFICTFNADLSLIDSAILRKGRCFAKYEFSELSAEKTAALLKELGHSPAEIKPMTLAEIYNYKDRSYDNKVTKKIGFSK